MPTPPKKPTSSSASAAAKKQAEALMKSYNARMNAAKQAETIAKSLRQQPKEKSYPKVTNYQTTKKGGGVSNNPQLYEDAAKKHRQLAKQDSTKAVKIYPQILKKK